MNEEELRKLMQSGFEKLRPHIEGIIVKLYFWGAMKANEARTKHPFPAITARKGF